MARKKSPKEIRAQIVEVGEGEHFLGFLTDEEDRIYVAGNFSTQKDAWWACLMATQAMRGGKMSITVDEFCRKVEENLEARAEENFDNVINFDDLVKSKKT